MLSGVDLGEVLLVVYCYGGKYLFRGGCCGVVRGVGDDLEGQRLGVEVHIREEFGGGVVCVGSRFSLNVVSLSPLLGGVVRLCYVDLLGIDVSGFDVLGVSDLERGRFENFVFELILRDGGRSGL